MGDRTGIEWTDATWNPVTGCDKVSPGCEHCYAETVALRFAGTKAYPDGFKVTLWPDRLEQPERWTKPRRIFVNSMSDLFHADIPDEYIDRVFDVMEHEHRHTFQVLTKRPGRMRSYMRARMARKAEYAAKFETCPTEAMRTSPAALWAQEQAKAPAANIWLGTSVEDQKWADVRVPVLLDTPAAVRFISAEPLLGPVDLTNLNGLDSVRRDWNGMTGAPHPLLDWVIVGGESGPGSRPMALRWAQDLRDQCVDSEHAAFLFKQWGDWAPLKQLPYDVSPSKSTPTVTVDGKDVFRVGKRQAGRLLDGQQHDGYPDAPAVLTWNEWLTVRNR